MIEPNLLAIFKPPWRLLRHESGNYRIVYAGGRVLCWIHVRGEQSSDYNLLRTMKRRCSPGDSAAVARMRQIVAEYAPRDYPNP
jgi:hypothetical protein